MEPVRKTGAYDFSYGLGYGTVANDVEAGFTDAHWRSVSSRILRSEFNTAAHVGMFLAVIRENTNGISFIDGKL